MVPLLENRLDGGESVRRHVADEVVGPRSSLEEALGDELANRRASGRVQEGRLERACAERCSCRAGEARVRLGRSSSFNLEEGEGGGGGPRLVAPRSRVG